MIPLIISSPVETEIEDYLKKNGLISNNAYFISTDGKSIGIDEIKELIRETKYACDPQTTPAFLIENGHLMTNAAQNALLKTLEEARPEHQFIITTDNHLLLLPTIISRCKLVILNNKAQEPESKIQEIINNFTTSPSNLLSQTDKIISRGAELTIRQLLHKLHNANRNFPTLKRSKIISASLVCLADLKSNINPKLAIDHFLLKSFSVAKMKPDHA